MRCASLSPLRHPWRAAGLSAGLLCLLTWHGTAQAQARVPMALPAQPSTSSSLHVVFVPLGASVQQVTLDLNEAHVPAHWEGRIGLDIEQGSTPLQDRLLRQHSEVATGTNVRSAYVLSDYYFFGGFRATAGLVHGSVTRSIWSGSGGEAGLDLSLQRLQGASLMPSRPHDPYGLERVTRPYIGAGYSFKLNRPGQLSAWRFNADLGLVSVDNDSIGRIGQTFSGEAAFSDIARELRFEPVLKVSVRYAF